MTAHAQPPAGPAPGAFDVVVNGGTPPYALDPLPSPPNPTPMPDHEIDGLHVRITGPVPPNTPLYFQATDALGNTATATYQVV